MTLAVSRRNKGDSSPAKGPPDPGDTLVAGDMLELR